MKDWNRKQNASYITRISPIYETVVSVVWVVGCNINAFSTVGLGQKCVSP